LSKFLDFTTPSWVIKYREIYKERGFKAVVKEAGWKVVVGIIIFYLIRDVILYIIIPYFIYKGVVQ
jgi:hypothetical protein